MKVKNDIVRSKLETKVSSPYVVDTKERANKIISRLFIDNYI